jgi:hypothetical protein
VPLTITPASVFALPPSLSFGIQLDTVPLLPAIPGTPQAVTLTNMTGVTLTGITATITQGPSTNASDFSVTPTGTTCNSSLNPGVSCTINIVFAPSISQTVITATGGGESATLSIADNAAGAPQGPQIVTLSGTAQPFTAVSGTTSGSISPGGTYTVALNVTLGPGTGTLVLSCAPGFSLGGLTFSCLFNGLSTLSIPQTGSVQMVQVVVTISTSDVFPSRRRELPPAGPLRWLPWSLIAAILLLGLWTSLAAAEKRRARAAWAFLALLVLCGGWMAACSSPSTSTSTSSGGSSSASATPPGSYTFVVTAQLGNLAQKIDLTLNVTQ